MNIVVILCASCSSRNLVGIKYHDQVAPPVALVVAEHIHQAVASTIQRDLHQLPQFIPGIENVITIHQKIFFHRFFLFCTVICSGIVYHLARAAVIGEFTLALAVGTGKDSLQFLVISSKRCGSASATTARIPSTPVRFRCCACFLSVYRKSGLDVHVMLHFIPRHHESGSVSAEYRAGRICQIQFCLIMGILYYLHCIVAGEIPLQHTAYAAASFRIGHDFPLIVLHGDHRNNTA